MHWKHLKCGGSTSGCEVRWGAHSQQMKWREINTLWLPTSTTFAIFSYIYVVQKKSAPERKSLFYPPGTHLYLNQSSCLHRLCNSSHATHSVHVSLQPEVYFCNSVYFLPLYAPDYSDYVLDFERCQNRPTLNSMPETHPCRHRRSSCSRFDKDDSSQQNWQSLSVCMQLYNFLQEMVNFSLSGTPLSSLRNKSGNSTM